MLASHRDTLMQVDRVGELLFGRKGRLRLALWIVRRDKPTFFQSEPPREVDVPSAVRQELGRLVDLGMLAEDRPDGDRRIYYTRTDSSLWKIIEAASEAIDPE
jgi:hypothetical protein